MKKGDRTFGKFRKEVISILTEFGFNHENRKPKGKSFDLNAQLHGPQIDGMMAESALKKINSGEAYYRLESDIVTMEWFWKSVANPGDGHPMTLAQAQEKLYDRLLFGYEFRYGEDNENFDCVRYIDFGNPMKNTFTAYEGWQGVKNDDFLWDLVLAINYIPVVGVVMKKTEKGQRHCESAYRQLREQLDADVCFSTSIQICVISDGEKTLVGTPLDTFGDYKPWPSLMGEDTQIVPEAKAPFMSLLRPDRLTNILLHFNHFVVDEKDGSPLYRSLSDYHQVFAVWRAWNAFVDSMEKGADKEKIGTIYLPEADSGVSNSGYGDQLETTITLLVDQLALAPFKYPDAYIQLLKKYPSQEDIDNINAHDGRVFLVAEREVTADDLERLLTQINKGKILRFDTYPAGPVLKKDFGPVLYRPTRLISRMEE